MAFATSNARKGRAWDFNVKPTQAWTHHLRLMASTAGLAPLSPNLPQVITEEFLTCKICLDHFIQPKILSCLHTFCLKCLESYAAKNPGILELVCPACRQVTDISRGITYLRDNFFIAGLQDVVSLDKTPGSVRDCDSCKSRHERKVAKMRCLNCQVSRSEHKVTKVCCLNCQVSRSERKVTMVHCLNCQVSRSEHKVTKVRCLNCQVRGVNARSPWWSVLIVRWVGVNTRSPRCAGLIVRWVGVVLYCNFYLTTVKWTQHCHDALS